MKPPLASRRGLRLFLVEARPKGGLPLIIEKI
jgi:hypothetical protein